MDLCPYFSVPVSKDILVMKYIPYHYRSAFTNEHLQLILMIRPQNKQNSPQKILILTIKHVLQKKFDSYCIMNFQ
jgi:hypothetical protein